MATGSLLASELPIEGTCFPEDKDHLMQAPPETLREMEKCARALAKSVQYVGAATVEFLYDLESCMYFFLELNPRLQASPLTALLVITDRRVLELSPISLQASSHSACKSPGKTY